MFLMREYGSVVSEIIVTTGDFGSVDLGTEMVGNSPQVVLIVLTLVRAPSFIIKVPTWLLKFPHSMFSEVLERLPMPMSNSSIPEGCVLQVNPILTLPGANARSHRLRTPLYKTVCAPPPNTRWGGCYPNFWLTVYKVPQLPSHVQLICWSSSQNSETFYLPCCYHLVAKLCPTLLQPHGL